METEKKTMPTKVVGGLVRFSYANVFQAKKNELNGKDQFSVCLLIPKKNKELLNKLKEGISTAIEQGISKCWNGKRPLKLKLPLRDGDEEKQDNPEYAGMYFINATSNNRPGVVDENCNRIMDESEFYSGCWGNFAINFYPFSQKGNNGVGAGLLNLQKVKEGEKLSGGSTPEQDFGKTTTGKKEDLEDDNDLLGDDLPF